MSAVTEALWNEVAGFLAKSVPVNTVSTDSVGQIARERCREVTTGCVINMGQVD